MLDQRKGRLTATTSRVVSALTLAFLFLSSTAVQAQQPSEPPRLRCGVLCWIIIIFIIIVLIMVIRRWLRGRKG